MRPSTAFIYDDIYLTHRPGRDHPESPQRLESILRHLESADLLTHLLPLKPIPVQMDWLHAVHTPQYVRLVEREAAAGRPRLSTGDTNICPESYAAALAAAGGAVAAVQAVASGQVRGAFCAVRPPGHHATADVGMGFCIFNNAAVAARYARTNCGIDRVLILDWDIHHGNGTQDIFYDDPSVFYCSTHLDHLYPMPLTGKGHASERGRGAGLETNLNIPLPAGTGDEEILAALRDQLLPAARRFQPQLLILSAGFDGRIGDPLGNFRITDDGFARLTRFAMELVPGVKTVSLLEGGYDLSGLGQAAASHVRALMEYEN